MIKKILILYGSETGTAQDVAEQIWRDAKRAGTNCAVMSMDDYNVTHLILEGVVIFVVATAGQGDPPTNMKKFWRFLLRKNLPTNSLQNLQYGVLGLGDSSYKKYNFAAKKLNRRLAQLGGREMLPIGLADDQHDLGIDAVTGPWTDQLWAKLSLLFSIPPRIHIGSENDIVMKFNVDIVDNRCESVNLNDVNVHRDIYRQELCMDEAMKVGRVLENTRTSTVDHFQDVRLLKFKVENVDYSPGDVVYVRPMNSNEKVEQFFQVLKNNKVPLNRGTVISVNAAEISVPNVLRQKLTLEEVAKQYWDLNHKPRKYTMEILGLITESELEKEKLIEFTTPSGQEELYNYVNRPRRNIIEVLNDFPNATKRLNVKLLFEIMSPIKPRAFSIASSLKQTPNQIDILVAVVNYTTKLFVPRLGLCSNWLAGLKPGDETTLWVQKGTFTLNYTKPAILIGPGTGVAPFRAFLSEKVSMQADLSDCLLFFGCRNQHKDYHCREEFELLVNRNKLRVFCAFSRDQEHKMYVGLMGRIMKSNRFSWFLHFRYVQHKIREQGDTCWRFLENDAIIYLAGNSKNMPGNVREEFVSLVQKFGKLSDAEAESYISQLEKSGRYQTETWG